MTLQDIILKTFERFGNNTLTNKEIYELNPLLNKGSIRSALSRMKKKGILESAGRATVEIKNFYKKIRHAKRIFDTHKKNPQRAFDVDLELTCEGFAPMDLTLPQIEKVVNPKLLDRGLELLSENGMSLFEEIIDFSVIGTEELQETSNEYNDTWEVEVKLVNNSGTQYLFNGYMSVAESEYQ